MSVNVSVILSRKGSKVITIASSASVAEAVTLLTEHNVGALVVSDDGETIDGIVSERDIVSHLAQSGPATLDHKVAQVMTADVMTCQQDATADDVMQTMTARRMRHLPVVDDDGRLTGIVSIGDVVKSRIDDLEIQAQSMQDYISGSPY
jgi:CBS domain-containing protein